jgi:hypothetical protein
MHAAASRRILAVLSAVALLVPAAFAATSPQSAIPARIPGVIDDAARATLPGTRNPHALAANDLGAVSPSMPLQGMTLVFAPSAAQQADLDALVAAQQNPGSPQYHQWLTPTQFAARFGVAASDVAKTEAWLQTEGFSVSGVSASGRRITFSGTAGQFTQAFGAQLHHYSVDGVTHTAPASDLSVPSALAGVVRTVANISDFRPQPQLVRRTGLVKAQPEFTSGQSGSNFLTPLDVDTIYDVNSVHSAGYTGTGVTIAVVGESAIVTSDITNFQTAAGVPVRAPNLVLVPGTGSSVVSSGDESESDIDLEYTSGIGTGASIDFVYTGSNQDYGVFDSLQYVIDEDLAPIISISYGVCEADLGEAYYNELNSILQQGAAQGQTTIAASGDSGSTSCNQNTTDSIATREAVSVNFPADSPYVTGLGGTGFVPADIAAGNTTYWKANTGTDVISSALSYIPETAWNDDLPAGTYDGTSYPEGIIGAGGGGVSTFVSRPSWQTGVPGIPSGSFRLVPDISLAASPDNPGYLFCSSDSAYTGVTGSCSHGFRDVNSEYLTVAGGTSFAAPVFAGMLSLVEQRLNKGAQGNINPILYTLASNATTYASAFHDITVGTNSCALDPAFCSGAALVDYSTGVGYDEATGLGSIDLANLIAAWDNVSAVSTVSLTPATATPAAGASDVITIAVASGTYGVSTVPTGSVSISVNGTVVTSVALTNGVATYTFSASTAGTDTITAAYSGDTVFPAAQNSITLNVGGTTTTSTAAFSLSATNITVAAGATGTSTVTVTPTGGFIGTVNLTATFSPVPANSCVLPISGATVTGTSPVTTTLTIYTNSSACTNAEAIPIGTANAVRSAANHTPASPFNRAPAAAALAGLLAIGLSRRRIRNARRIRPLLALALLAVIGFGISGCGSTTSSSTTSSSANTPAGTYTITVTGASSNAATNATTTFTLTVQ